MKELNVGNPIYLMDWCTDEMLKKLIVDRITPKMAFVGKLKFKRQYRTRVQHIGSGHRLGNNYYLPKLIN